MYCKLLRRLPVRKPRSVTQTLVPGSSIDAVASGSKEKKTDLNN